MALGPIELFVVGFPGNNFTGEIRPRFQELIDRGIVTLVDGLFIIKDPTGETAFFELEQADANPAVAELADLINAEGGLLSDEDVDDIAESLDPDSSALALVIEHTWMKPVRDAVTESGGTLMMNVRVPGAVVEEVLAAVAEAE